MVDNELNSDEYSSKISRDRPLACVLASRMLASYVPLTERWPDACHRSRRYSARYVAGSMQHRERISLNMASTFKASGRSLARDKIKACTRAGWDPLCAREADVAECFSTPAAYGDLYIIIDVFRHHKLHCTVSSFHVPGAMIYLRFIV